MSKCTKRRANRLTKMINKFLLESKFLNDIDP